MLKHLLAAKPADIARVAHRLRGDFVTYLNRIDAWQICCGDLCLAGSFDLGCPLIVDGNLTIAGGYTDGPDYDDHAHLICLGNFSAHHVLTRNVFYVEGDVTVHDFVYATGNDYPLQIGGLTRAPWVRLSERCIEPAKHRFEGKLLLDLDTGIQGDAQTLLNPELLEFWDDDGNAVDTHEAAALKDEGQEVLVLARPDWRSLIACARAGSVFL
jgi:hypothetical protein